MAQKKELYHCTECGSTAPKMLGKCPECGRWNTYVPIIQRTQDTRQPIQDASTPSSYTLEDLKSNQEKERIPTSLEALNRVLGGGIVQGSVILIGGEPGIGKSTLLLQVADSVCQTGRKVLYSSGEESPPQIGLRAERLGIETPHLYLSFETELETLQMVMKQVDPACMIIDSIQTVYRSEVPGSAGSIPQVRESTNFLIQLAKRTHTTIFIVGHVTKDGQIAGPKFLEHLVDVVLYLEGDKNGAIRLLRSQKNRFGETQELGVFNMTGKGLQEIKDPSEIFLSEKAEHVPGTLIFPSMEGNRPLFLEIQALGTASFMPVPRRVATGIDFNRLLMLLAILEKRARIPMGGMDVFLNVTGGVKITDPAIDLSASLSIASSIKDLELPERCVAFGELGLSGEVRPVANTDRRIQEALRRNFKPIVVSRISLAKEWQEHKNILAVDQLSEALNLLF